MNLINDLTALRRAIQAFCVSYGSNLPAGALASLLGASSSVSSVAAVCDTAECLYAYRAAITDAPTLAAARTLCGQCASFGGMNAWHGLGDNGRGSSIYQAMCRELGETPPAGLAWPTTAEDPSPDVRFTAPASTPAPTIAAPPPAPGRQPPPA